MSKQKKKVKQLNKVGHQPMKGNVEAFTTIMVLVIMLVVLASVGLELVAGVGFDASRPNR